MLLLKNNNYKFHPKTKIDYYYNTSERKLEWKGTSVKEWEVWNRELKNKLMELLGLDSQQPYAIKTEFLSSKEFDSYTREEVVLETSPETQLHMYILIPKNLTTPSPAVMCLHGHGYGNISIVGLWEEDGKERNVIEGYQKDFALEIVKRGMIAVAPEILGFGRRRNPENQTEYPVEKWSCREAALHAMLMGRTLMGFRVWDAMKVLDYMETRQEIDGNRIGCMGISGGGMLTMYTSALEPRIKAAVISGYLNTYKNSIMNLLHCECNYVPGILQYAEMHDIASLIAPRPVLYESGTHDEIFPFETAKLAFEKVEKLYRLLGGEKHVKLDAFEGRHQISGRMAYDFLMEHL